MADESLAVFMDVTGCGYDDAFHRLASCGGHLGEAINRFFSIDAGPSGTTRSPPPPPSPQLVPDSSSEEEEDDDNDYAPPAPAARPAERRGWAPRVSRWDSETRGGGGSSSRLVRRDDTEADANRSRGEQGRRAREDDSPSSGGRDAVGSRRRRPFDLFADSSSESEEKAEASSRSLRCRRLNPIDISSDSDNEVEATNNGSRCLTRGGGGSDLASGGGAKKSDDSAPRRRFRESILSFHDDSDMEVDEPPPPPKKKKPKPENEEETVEEFFRVPRGLMCRGGFHAAKAHAARRGRWLLANVQSLDLPSLAQNRDVWGSDLVSGCVGEHFVLWQANADDARGGGGGAGKEEAEKVLCYYKVPRERLPVVLVIDPVTGQAVNRLHGTDPNDFVVSIGPYTAMKPILPIVVRAAANKSSASAGAQSNRTPAATAPTSRQEQPPAAVRKSSEPVAAAAGAEKVCKMRVRLPDGRVVAKEFGSECAVAALFAYCRSELGAGAAAGKTMRLLRFVGASREEINNGDASFKSLGLNMSTVCVELG